MRFNGFNGFEISGLARIKSTAEAQIAEEKQKGHRNRAVAQ